MRHAFWIVVLGLLGISRIPVAAEYFSIDNVNLALSLESFDPLNHRPQPPGYPFFVGLARMINVVAHDAAWTFLAIAVLSSAGCLIAIHALGRRMFSNSAGQAAALLLLVNPVFWLTCLAGPLRGFLGLFSLLTAYCAWRAWNGETSWVLWGAFALGIGGGFRPDLLPVLFPLWLISGIAGSRSLRSILAGVSIMGAVTLVWLTALVMAAGGIAPLMNLNSAYVADESYQWGSVLFGADAATARRQLGRLVIWNGLGVAGWIWAAPLAMGTIRSAVDTARVNRLLFFATWLLPGIILQALIHVADPAHTLFSIVGLCLMGGWIIGRIADSRRSVSDPGFAGAILALAVAVNVMLFLNFLSLPANDAPSTGWRKVRNAAAYGIFESSIGQVRWLDEMADVTVRELKELAPNDRPWIVISSDDANRREWFTNWRIVRYYAPDADMWITNDQHEVAHHIRYDRTVETLEASPEDGIVRIPIPRGGRVLWLIEHGGALHRALQSIRPLEGGQRLFYTDVPNDAQAFSAWNYEFVPTPN